MSNTVKTILELWISDSRGQLGTLDITTKEVKVIGNMGVTMFDIAWSPDGELWGTDGRKVYKIDSTTAKISLVGDARIFLNAMTFDKDGTLYTAGRGLYTINTNTGAATTLGNLPVPSGGDLAFVDGQLYLSTSNSELYKVNIANPASSERVGAFGIANVYGIAATAANGAVYGAGAGNRVVKVSLETGKATPVLIYGGGLGEPYGMGFQKEAIVVPELEPEPQPELEPEPESAPEPPTETEGDRLKKGPKGSDIDATSFEILPSEEAPRSRIKRVLLHGGWAVDKIQVGYENLTTNPPETYLSEAFGGKGGGAGEFTLEAEDYIVEVLGSWGRQAPGYPKEEIVSLQFQTHKGQTSRVFGGGNPSKEVEEFSLRAPKGYEVIGFFGAFGSHQNSLVRIGIYCQPLLDEAPQVEIADIFYDGSVKYVESDEFIEISNKGLSDADISGWKINGDDRQQDFFFPAGTILKAGTSYRVYTNEVHPETGGFSFKIGRAIWNNKGDVGRLYDASGNLVSSFGYGQKKDT